jgi:hypothetical protein
MEKEKQKDTTFFQPVADGPDNSFFRPESGPAIRELDMKRRPEGTMQHWPFESGKGKKE